MSEDRADYIDGLRQLADLLDENPDVPLPYHGERPDPNAPLVEVTTEVERVEWICSPILSGGTA